MRHLTEFITKNANISVKCLWSSFFSFTTKHESVNHRLCAKFNRFQIFRNTFFVDIGGKCGKWFRKSIKTPLSQISNCCVVHRRRSSKCGKSTYIKIIIIFNFGKNIFYQEQNQYFPPTFLRHFCILACVTFPHACRREFAAKERSIAHCEQLEHRVQKV